MKGKRAIIDIGSNTVRLVVFGGPPRAPMTLHNEKVTARLGRGVAETGLLGADAMDAALKALGRYARLIELMGVKDVRTVATAASRDATNGGAFLDAVRAIGLSPRLLSGEEEALTSAMGVIGAFPGARGVVADLGGGSLELVHVEAGLAEHGTSLPLGTLRLPAMRATGPDRFARRIGKVVRADGWHCTEGEALYLVGGSFRAFARLAMHRAGWPVDDPHGFEMTSAEALKLARQVLRSQTALQVPGLSASRLASLPDTAALLAVLLGQVEPSRLAFSSWGLREGLLFAALAPSVRAEDPLRASVDAFTAPMGASWNRALAVTGWAQGAFPAPSGMAEQLRPVAAALALAAQAVEPNLRSDTATAWALRKRWVGLDAGGRAWLAAALAAQSGRAAVLPQLDALANAGLLAEAAAWGLALRLCRRLTGFADGALAAGGLGVQDGALVLGLPAADAILRTEGTQRDLAALAAALGVTGRIEVAEGHSQVRAHNRGGGLWRRGPAR